MAFKYFPHTDTDIQQMLHVCGASSLDALYADVPESILMKKEYDLPKAQSEMELRETFAQYDQDNTPLICLAGAGCYDHYTPAVVQNLVQRSEFLTSYTPYQAEISQGTLHYIFEYQSMMAELTGMDISNASMYDGATATAEAAIMAFSHAKKATKVLLSSTIDPKTLQVVKTYAKYHGIEIEMIAAQEGTTDPLDLKQKLQEGGIAGVIVQQPNYYGIIEDLSGYADNCHEHKALLIINSVAADLAILKTPGEWGADIAVGEAQSLGIPMSFGGPGLGYMCCSEKLIRKMPGRIVGMTKDNRGQRAFVLTLQAREQHIRRQKATSNICSNQSLMALHATIYMAVMGKEGMKEAAEQSYAKAHWLHDELQQSGLFTPTFKKPFFNEFCMDYDGDIDELQATCGQRGFQAGVKVNNHTIMFAVTEKRTIKELTTFVNIIKEIKEERR